MKKKHSIAVDNTEICLLKIFTDLQNDGYAILPYDSQDERWRAASKKISKRASDIIYTKNPLLFPPMKSRWNRMNMIVKPKDVEITVTHGNKKTFFHLEKKIF